MTTGSLTPTLAELRSQPAPEFTERDPEAIKRTLIAKFEEISGRKLYPAQVENFMINLMAYALSNVASAIQTGLLQNIVIWAEGRHLDDLGSNVGTYRLPAQAARAEVEFTLSALRNSPVVIPAATRVAAGSTLIFRTEKELVIPTGETSGKVDAIATATGVAFNDLLPGQIQDILDPVAYVSAVANTQNSGGGSDIEDDDRFRGRVINAFERISRGGSRRGYIELVKAVHPDIVDVEPVRPQPGHIYIYPLMKTGVAPDVIDDAIIEYLDPEDKIPMGDFVSVQKVTSQVFDVVMTIRVAPGFAASATEHSEAITRAQFDTWGSYLGAQVAPSALVGAVRTVPGVIDASDPGFAFTDLPRTHFAALGNLTINAIEAPDV